MGELLMRRREMILPSSSAKLVYELDSPVSTQNYDTGVVFFDEARSFTVLCEADCNIYNWSSTKSAFGIGTGNSFRVGYVNSFNSYSNGAKDGTGSNYCALVFNNAKASDPDSDIKKCGSLWARGTNAKTVKRFAVRYDHEALRVHGFSSYSSSFHAPNSVRWWDVHKNYVTDPPYYTLKLNIGTGTTCTVNALRIYHGLLSDEQINAFLDGGA